MGNDTVKGIEWKGNNLEELQALFSGKEYEWSFREEKGETIGHIKYTSLSESWDVVYESDFKTGSIIFFHPQGAIDVLSKENFDCVWSLEN